MAELSLKQITEKLNGEFVGETRKLIFWYDSNAEFKDDIDSLDLINAKVLHLNQDNQFYVKYFLEVEDKETNYLVYAPFAKPGIRDNHLTDTIAYSKEFFADRASLIALDLGIDERLKPVIQKYSKFFASKDRMQKFYDLEINNYTRSIIEIALMSVLCKSRTTSFEDITRTVLTDDGFENNKYLAEFDKYGLLESFWAHIDAVFGYCDAAPTLEKLTFTLFVSYISKTIRADIPSAWKNYVSSKAGNIMAFVDGLMNSVIYGKDFNVLSDLVYRSLDAETQFSKMNVEDYVDCYLFKGIDQLVIKWMVERLENEDINAKLNSKTIEEVSMSRRKHHYGSDFKSEYFVIENAYYLLSECNYHPADGIKNIVKNYINSTYQIDRKYRYFYYYYDQIEDTTSFEKLRELVENIYTNDYLNNIAVNWNDEFGKTYETGLTKQINFFNHYVANSKDRTLVIISDAFRYEVARTLFDKLQQDEKCTCKIDAIQSVLPSYTPLGMAALLPHLSVEYTDDYHVSVNGKPCATTDQREQILRAVRPNSKCVQFDSVKSMKQAELRGVLTGMDVVYVYHNQIDARGDAAKTENEVFIACEEAVNEIHAFMRRVATQANTYHFVITADHGFIYKRDKIAANDKISLGGMSESCGQRYAIGSSVISNEGVCSIPLSTVLQNKDDRVVSYPLGSDIFKVSGAGQNYVHGGSSPQEMIVPVIDAKFERGKIETTNAKVALVSLTTKITNLITSLDFVQVEPVGDAIKETDYRLYFIDEDGEKISNEHILKADKKDSNTAKRMFRLRFNFKNQKYQKTKKYYLVAYDDKNDMEVIRHEVIMDIAFADDFGFSIF